VLLYDGDCRFCRFSARLAARADRRRRLGYLALQDPEAEPLLAGVPEERRLDRLRLAEPAGALLAGGHAVAGVLGYLVAPPLRRLGPLLEPPYALVSRLRGPLGRVVPDGPGPRRSLDRTSR